MSLPEPAVADVNWLEPQDLYLASGDACEIDRPIFQGDVYSGVPLPSLPRRPPAPGKIEIEFTENLAMLLPHPCQCYNGDSLRPFLTVAPVTEVPSYDSLGPQRDRAFDKFALPDLPVMREGVVQPVSHVASFGRLITVPREYLLTTERVACLSHKGLGLLAKRLIRFQLRMPTELGDSMAYTMSQWNEAYLMQAWVRKYKTLKGYSAWLKTPRRIETLDAERDVVPGEYLVGAVDVLISEIDELDS